MKRLISLAISLGLLAIIYWKIDFRGLYPVFAASDGLWLGASLLMVVPLTLITAIRFRMMVPPDAGLSMGEANKLILAASVLNMILPSKMGDIAKAYFMRDRCHLSGTQSLSIVVFEKAWDMLSLLLWCCFGLLFFTPKSILFWGMTLLVGGGLLGGVIFLFWPPFANAIFQVGQRSGSVNIRNKLEKLHATWEGVRDFFWKDKKLLVTVTGISVFLWFLHLFQIWLFIKAIGVAVPVLANLALAPLSILAGLLPLTFAGVGTRDGAIIFFYHDYMSPHAAAALGLLCTSRYLLPAIGGLPFFAKYMQILRDNR
jgi:uncharacterized protein (TIRG00374 family)